MYSHELQCILINSFFWKRMVCFFYSTNVHLRHAQTINFRQLTRKNKKCRELINSLPWPCDSASGSR